MTRWTRTMWLVGGLVLVTAAWPMADQCVAAQQVTSIVLSESIEGDGMALDGRGSLLVASGWETGYLARVDLQSGQVDHVTEALLGPIDVEVAPDGTAYATSWRGRALSRITSQGVEANWLPIGPKADALVLDKGGNLWVTSGKGRWLKRVSPDGKVTTVLQGDPFEYIYGVAVSDEGVVYVADPPGYVYEVSPQGELTLIATIPGTGEGARIGGMVWANGRLYGAGLDTHRVWEIRPDGRVSVLAGTGDKARTDGPAAMAQFSDPMGVAVSADGGTLYVVSVGETDRIRVINLTTRTR